MQIIQHFCTFFQRGVRVVEGARLESVYTSKGYRGFESLPLYNLNRTALSGFFCVQRKILSTSFKPFNIQIFCFIALNGCLNLFPVSGIILVFHFWPMIQLLETIKQRNELLFYFGLFSILGASICLLLLFFTKTEVMGVNAWLKPFKFFFSTVLFVWTLAWAMQFLDNQIQVKVYSWVAVIGLGFELLVISGQASLGKQSHFNVSTPFDAALFSAMGVVIVIVTLWTGFIVAQFFIQDSFSISETVVWGIRLGIMLSVIFAFEGGLMGSLMQHTVGAADGGEGLPLVNWSRRYGDLRIAHFLGLHALQLIPLFSVFLARNVQQVWWFAGVYFVLVSLVMIQALMGKPLIN
jgi:hypothetical protein